MRFKPGDYVMCIDDTMYHPELSQYFVHVPRVGDTYRVRAVDLATGREGLRFEGVINRIHPKFNVEVGYYAFKFVHAPPIEEGLGESETVSRRPHLGLRV